MYCLERHVKACGYYGAEHYGHAGNIDIAKAEHCQYDCQRGKAQYQIACNREVFVVDETHGYDYKCNHNHYGKFARRNAQDADICEFDHDHKYDYRNQGCEQYQTAHALAVEHKEQGHERECRTGFVLIQNQRYGQ